jgi:hypothetical protein
VDNGSIRMGHLKTVLRTNSQSEAGPAPSPVNRAGMITCAKIEEEEQQERG